MLKQEDKDKLKSFGFNVEEIETAVKSETEAVITIPVGTFMDEASLSARDANKISEGKTLGISEGKVAGFEIANKAIIEKFSLKDVKKSDEPTKIVEALHTQMGKGDEGLQGQINALLNDKTTLETKVLTLEGEKKTIERSTTLLGMLPKNRTSVLSDSEYLSLLNSNIEEIDGKMVVKLNGEVLRNGKTQDLLPLNEGIAKVFESRKWLDNEPTPGRGGNNSQQQVIAGIKTLSGFNEAYIKAHEGEQNPLLSDEYRQAVVIAAKEPNFDMDK